MKNLVNACKAKVMNNHGDQSIDSTLLVVVGIMLIALFITIVVKAAESAMNSSNTYITGQTRCAMEGKTFNIQLDNGKGGCQ